MPLFKKKQTTQNALEEFNDIENDVIESDFVPYACHWNDSTIVTRNSEVMQVIRIVDEAVPSAAGEEISLRDAIREAILASVDSQEYAVWIHTVRRKKSFQSPGEFKRDFAGYLDRFWKDRNDWEHKYVNEVYISVVRDGQSASLLDPRGFVRQIVPRFDIRHREEVIDKSIAKLTRVTDKLMKELSSFAPKRLGLVKQGETWYSDVSSFLSKLITLQDSQIEVEQASIADTLTNYDITFGYNAMEVRMRGDGSRRFAAYLTVKEYREIPLESTESVLKMPMEFVMCQCFMFVNSKYALKGYEYQEKLFKTGNAASLAESSGLRDILASAKGKPNDFCEYQLGIFLLSESIKSLESNVLKAVNALSALGLSPMREDIMLEECYWSMLPASFAYLRRLRPLNTRSMAGFANLSMLPCGKEKDNHWGGALATFNTIKQTPYYFNFHTGDNGHTTLLGPTGSGKKVLMNFLVAQARKYDGKLFYFDRNRLAEPFIRSIEGVYFNPMPGADQRPYASLSLNPLQLEDTEANRKFIRNWLLMLAGSAADAALAESCTSVAAAIMAKPKSERQFSVCAELLVQNNAAWSALLAPWIAGGKHARIFNNQEDTLVLDGKVVGFEMEALVQQPETLAPVLAYLLHRIMQALDGKPAMVVMDEAWTLLESNAIAPRLKSWLKAMREKNAMALFASEHIDEIKHSPVNAELLPEIATKLFLPDESADASYVDAFGLQMHDIAYLPVMDTEDRHFLVSKKNESIVLEMDLSGMVDIVAVLSASEYHLNVMEQAITARGISPSQWMPKFLESV